MSTLKILVLGAGQLGAMLAEAASRLGFDLHQVDPERWALRHGTSLTRIALSEDWQGEGYDIVTVEREHFVDRRVLELFEEHPGFVVLPALDRLADRRRQKALLDEIGVATAEWTVVHDHDELEHLSRRIGAALIVKSATGGYDGRGQWRYEPGQPKELDGMIPGEAIAERMVDFDREVSLVGARGPAGACVFYPLAENVHREGMLRCTVAPAATTPELQAEAESMLTRIMQALDYVGVMAMECFEEAGHLLVNELAPRVHNSGHWTQEGASIDQFELHLRAITGLPLAQPEVTRPTAMLNLVGVEFDRAWLRIGRSRLHWYGKSFRQGRKLGHLNLYADSAGSLAELVESAGQALGPEQWEDLRSALGILQR